jgi:hypothetical protein
MIRFYRNAIETAWADHRARRALVWECVRQRTGMAVKRQSNAGPKLKTPKVRSNIMAARVTDPA